MLYFAMAFTVPNVMNIKRLSYTSSVPYPLAGTPFMCLHLTDKKRQTLDTPLWVLVIGGELIIDLPHGDFRILRHSEALHLPYGITVVWNPVEPVVLLLATLPTDPIANN